MSAITLPAAHERRKEQTDEQGQAVVVARNIEEQKVLILDRADMSFRIRLHGCDVWATADRGDLHPAHQRLLEALY